jgi:glucose-1-phosphate adenylyltransferase
VETDGKISSFVEKPKDPEIQQKFVSRAHDEERPFLGSMGIYLFKTKVLIDLLTRFPEYDDGRISERSVRSMRPI